MICLPRVSALVFALASFTPDFVSAQSSKTTVNTQTASIQCNSSDAGECHILLYTHDCQDGPPANGRTSLVCTSRYWQEFSLKVGEVRVLQNAPPNFKQCAQTGKSKPVFPACAK